MKNFTTIIVAFLILTPSFVKAFDPFSTESTIPRSNLANSSCSTPDLKLNKIDIFQVINLVLCRNPATRMAWLEMKNAAANLGEKYAEYLPSVSLTTSKPNQSSDFSSLVSFEWLLYDFGRREADINQAYFLLEQSRYQHADLLQQTVYQVIQLYCNFFSAQAAVDSALRSEEAYRSAATIAKEKYTLGLAPKADLLKAQTQFAQSTLTRQKQENTVAVYQGQLMQILNFPQGTKINLIKPKLMKRNEQIDQKIEILIQKAFEHRSDLKAIEAKEQAYQAALKSAGKSRWPKIILYGNSGKINSYDNDNINNIEENSVGIKLTLPLFNGFQKTYYEKKQRYTHKSVQQEKDQTKNTAAFEVWSAYHALKTEEKNFEVAQQMLKTALENKNVALGMYKAGKGTMLEILEAEASLSSAENEKNSAEYNQIIAEAALLKALGVLKLNKIN